MQRQRGELVPIGDALSGMGGPVKLIRDATPQALHGASPVADQVNQLVEASEADPGSRLHGADDGAVLAAPHQPRQPASVQVASQRPVHAGNDRRALGFDNKLPYGNLPRLLLAWVCDRSGAHRKPRVRSREIASPTSCGQAGRGFSSIGGKLRTRLRNQMKAAVWQCSCLS